MVFLGLAMLQAVSHWPLSSEARFDPKPCEICGGQNGIVRDFDFLLSVSFPPLIHTHSFLYHHLCMMLAM